MRHLAFVMALVLMSITSPALLADEEAQTAAVNAAENWLALVDGGEYSKSWQEAAAYFRTAVSEETWGQSLAAVRAPLGEVLSRRVQAADYMTELPGAPDGEYVVIRFATSFAKKENAVETVTPMKEEDGSWRVSGYFIK